MMIKAFVSLVEDNNFCVTNNMHKVQEEFEDRYQRGKSEWQKGQTIIYKTIQDTKEKE